MASTNNRSAEEGGVDRVIDPTKNVLDLVQAAIQRQDNLREAESRRITDLSDQRRYYETVIEGMRNSSLALLATQVKETKDDLSDRITKIEVVNAQNSGRGLGINAAAGWVIAIVMAGIAYFKH